MKIKRWAFVLSIVTFLFPQCSNNLSEAELNAIMDRASQQYEAGHYQEALDGFLEISENTQQQRSEYETRLFISSQTMAVMCYESLGRYEEGYKLCELLLKAKLTNEEESEVQHLFVMNGYCWALTMMQTDNKQFVEARKVLNEILPLSDEEMKSKILVRIPLSWYFQGADYQMKQNYVMALPCMEEARKAFHELGQIGSEIDVLCEIGTMKGYENKFEDALGVFREARKLATKKNDDARLISVLWEERKMSQRFGDTETAAILDTQMNSIAEATSSDKAKFEFNNYKGTELQNQKRYRLAEQWYKRNATYINHKDKEKYNWANLYLHHQRLYELYAGEGNAAKALEHAKSALENQIDGKHGRDYYMPYIWIAHAYQMMKDSVNCFHALDSLFLSLSRFEEPKEIKTLYEMRGLNYQSFGRHDLGLRDFQKADEILATKYDENDGDRVQLVALLAGCEYKLGNYGKSEQLYKKYAEKVKLLYGESSEAYTMALIYLANIEGFAGHIENGCKTYTTAAARMREQIKRQLPYYTAYEREHYWEPMSELLNNMTPYALKAKEIQSSFTEACYEGLVLTKAFLLESERSTYDIIKKYGTSNDLHDYMVLSNWRGKIKSMENDYQSNADSIMVISSRINIMERKLADRCKKFEDITSFVDVGYDDIKNALNRNEVLLDFTDFKSEEHVQQIAAFVVDRKQVHPKLVKSFTEEQIKILLADKLADGHMDFLYKEPYASKALKLIWEPLAKEVKGKKTIYYVPSGILHRIALESLPLSDGSLLGEHYDFVRLTSAREIVKSRKGDQKAHYTTATLYGALNYDMDTTSMVHEASRYKVEPQLSFSRGETVRGSKSWTELPNTKEEIDRIKVILKSRHLKVSAKTGIEGTEESFLALSGKAPQLLHIATHGFYYNTPEEAKETSYLKGYYDAMQLSGLIMAGGNRAWTGKETPKGIQDGVLTANSIAAIDLRGTDMVVLSACKTGLGVSTPEGLFGLQRAFKKAGVQTIIMSLWNVDDEAAKDFMIKFYEELVESQDKWDKRKAFEKAKTFVRSKTYIRKGKSYKGDPYYWAGFVMLD